MAYGQIPGKLPQVLCGLRGIVVIMKKLADLISSHEDWLVSRILQYAEDRGYVKYTSTLAEAWRTSIAGLSQPLIMSLDTSSSPPELNPDEDYLSEPIAAFGVMEAKRHRSRGVTLPMFLGLMKYYRQSYIDLVVLNGSKLPDADRCRLFIERFFDRVEIGFLTEWTRQSENSMVADLQTTNRILTNEKNKYLTIFESLANPIIFLNDNDAIENMNYAAQQLFENGSVPGTYYYGHGEKPLPKDWLSNELAEFKSNSNLGLVVQKELTVRNSLRQFEVSIERMLDVSGKFSGTITTLNDITERRRAEQIAQDLIENERKLLQAGKLQSLAVMAGGIAHDFNNHLMALLGNLQLALGNAPVGATITKRIEHAIVATDKLAILTHQLLVYTGQKYYRKEELDLFKIIRNQVEAFQADLPANVILNIRNSSDIPVIRGDESQMERVFNNLVTNSVEAIGDGTGEINILTGVVDCDQSYLAQCLLKENVAPGNFVFLEVSDNGCGLDEETRSRMFDPFFSTKFWGRGLGLPEVMGIVRSQKGAIFVNTLVGKGTTVRVLFPLPTIDSPALAMGDELIKLEAEKSSQPDARKTVLVIEDEVEVRELCLELLELFGYDTIGADNGEEGVQKFLKHQNRIDVVLLDLIMPKMDGFEAFAQLIRIKPDVKVVISSGFTIEALENKFKDSTPAGFLHKPYQMDKLREELDRVIKIVI
jgi:signal transduction histidine kinase/ActR/RegA family two-component response regulator